MFLEKLQLDADETILFKVRKHWFVIAVQIFSIVIIALLPLFLFSTLIQFLPLSETNISYTGYVLATYATWLIMIWITLFNVWTNYYLDIWTLTNKRLIAIDQRGLFNRKTASFRLERMQDVTISIDGMLPTFLKFGTLEIQTAGEEGNFKVHGLPDPEFLKATILDATDMVNSHEHRHTSDGI